MRAARTMVTRVIVASIGVALVVLAAALDVGSSPTAISAGGQVAGVLCVCVAAAVAVRIESRLPGHLVGQLLSAVAAMGGLFAFLEVYARIGLAGQTHHLPGAGVADAASATSWVVAFGFLGWLVLVFPDGRLPTPSSRTLARVSVAAVLGAWVASALQPGVQDGGVPRVNNSLGVDWLGRPAGQVLVAVLMLAMFGSILAIAVVATERYAVAGGIERLQMRWLAFSMGTVPPALTGCYVAQWVFHVQAGGQLLVPVSLTLVPLAMGIGVLEYRLYDIDRLINGTVVYASVTVVLSAAFLGASLVAGGAVGQGSSWATAAATALIVTAFRPVRAMVGDVIDRRFSRAKYDGRRHVARFLADLRQGQATPEGITAVLAEALGDPTVELRLWLPSRQAYLNADGQPVHAPPPIGPADQRSQRRIDLEGAHHAIVVHDPRLCDRPDVLDGVLAGAALAIELVQLRVEVADHLAFASESRVRILEAGIEERRRLERDLHDGAQQRLVSLGLSLRRLQRSLPHEANILEPALDQAVAQVGDALADLRRLASGGRPSRLDAGLAAALADLARTSPLPVAVAATEEPLPTSVEAAAYFIACEAVTNAVKHAKATTINVATEVSDGHLLVAVTDDGIGGATITPGSGLAGLAERVAAHGGRLAVTSEPGDGTALTASLPCQP